MKTITNFLIVLSLILAIPNLSSAIDIGSDEDNLSPTINKKVPAKKQKKSSIKSKVVVISSDEEGISADESETIQVVSQNSYCPHCSHLRAECLTAKTHGVEQVENGLITLLQKEGGTALEQKI